MDFREIFQHFTEEKQNLKVVSVASCDLQGKPNSAPKMLIDIAEPNLVFFLDYKFTQTYTNLQINPQLSLSFMNDAAFTGYRMTGVGQILESGPEFEAVKKCWDKRVIAYETDRIIQRIRGGFSTKASESSLPKNFVIVKFTSKEASVVKPDRVFRAQIQE